MQYKNTKKQGDFGLGAAIAYFCSEGMPVSVPLTDSQDYDLVVEFEDGLKKIQVRTTTQKSKSGFYIARLRVCGGNSKKNFVHKRGSDLNYDFLFVASGDGRMFLMPKPTNENEVTLNHDYDKFEVGGA